MRDDKAEKPASGIYLTRYMLVVRVLPIVPVRPTGTKLTKSQRAAS